MEYNIIILALLIPLFILNFGNFIYLLKKTFTKYFYKTKRIVKEPGVKRQVAIQVSDAVKDLSSTKTGALITFEKETDLTDYIAIGVIIDANVDEQLLKVIFNKSSLLHDGAVIIRGGKIVCTSAYFPATSKKLAARFGSRHRAAMGISERTDALTIIISETTGQISYTYKSKIVNVDNSADLFHIIYKHLTDKKSKSISFVKQTDLENES